MFKSIKKQLIKYNEYKFSFNPKNKLVAIFPILLSPLFGMVVLQIMSACLVTYLAISTPEFSFLSRRDKGISAMYAIFSVSGLAMILSYLYTLLILYPVSKILKHENNNQFLGSTMVISFAISLLFGFLFYDNGSGSYGYLYLILPFCIMTLWLINSNTFKLFNELIERDIDGKIVYWSDKYNNS